MTSNHVAKRGNPPTVSIGLPVYNGGRFLASAIESALSQTFDDFELIIADNASTDETAAVARRYAQRDARIRYIRRSENVGAQANYNQLVHEARGKYFHWLASDDILHPCFLESCVSELDRDPSLLMAYPLADAVDGSGASAEVSEASINTVGLPPHERWVHALKEVWNTKYLSLIYGVMRRDALLKTRLFVAYPGADMVLVCELALHGCFLEIPERLFVRRFHDERLTAKYSKMAERAREVSPEIDAERLMPTWRYLRELFAVLAGATIAPGERLRCITPVFRFFVTRYRHKLIRECRRAATRTTRRFRRGVSRRKATIRAAMLHDR